MWRNLVRGGEIFLRASCANKNMLRVRINYFHNFMFLKIQDPGGAKNTLGGLLLL